MIEETGTVTGVEGDMAWVETRRSGACGSCSVSKGCGTSVLASVLGRRRTRVRALNRVGADAGDQVVIGIAEDALVRGSVVVYLLPLISLMVGAVLGSSLWQWWSGSAAQWPAIVAGGAGLAVGLVWVRVYGARIRYNPAFQPVILRRETSVPVDFVSGAISKHF